MGTKRAAPLDHAVAALASRQHGVVARSQLLELGLSASALKGRLAAGRLHRLHRGVYAVGHGAISACGRWLAAVLAAGPGAVLSHRCACALHGIRSERVVPAEVTVPASNRRPRAGIVVHVTRGLHGDDRALRHGIPVASVARALLDLAGVRPAREVERAYGEAQRLGLLNVRAVARLLERSSGRRGAAVIASLLAQDRAAVALTRSELEARFLASCREAGLPKPLVNVHVAGWEVDACWPAARLVVELDSYAFHRTRVVFERDRLRDAAVQRAGFRVLRITHRMLDGDAEATLATVRSLHAPSDRSTS